MDQLTFWEQIVVQLTGSAAGGIVAVAAALLLFRMEQNAARRLRERTALIGIVDHLRSFREAVLDLHASLSQEEDSGWTQEQLVEMETQSWNRYDESLEAFYAALFSRVFDLRMELRTSLGSLAAEAVQWKYRRRGQDRREERREQISRLYNSAHDAHANARKLAFN